MRVRRGKAVSSQSEAQIPLRLLWYKRNPIIRYAQHNLDGFLPRETPLQNTKKISLSKEVFFASETPNYGEFHTTVFNDKWKLVQVISSSLMEISVKNQLFNINDDPNEYKDLSSKYPKLVELMADKIRKWRALHPISGIRAQLVPPPGWRAPKDWSSYTIPIDKLQDDASLGFGAHAHQILDFLIKFPI